MNEIEIAQASPWTYTTRVMKAVAVVMLIGFFLAGCQTTEPQVITEIVERRIEIPQSLLTCEREPVAGTAWLTQRDVGRYMIELAEAGEDCRTKLDAVRRLIDGLSPDA